ncbi:MAG: sulfotransferase [Rhodocyclales bacterium]|nr:sulfotransferase [Rhodocyclales bacterium]
MKLSPICICPYGRLRHLQRTIEALKRNPEAAESDLYLFSDAPRAGDEERVAAVRRYLPTIGGFRSVEIIERASNDRVGNWVGGEMSLLDRFGRVISLEDDLVVAPGFLGFINAGLEKYAGDPRIFAVCGYTPSMRLEWVTQEDACLAPRYSGWGYGYWKRSLELVPRRIVDYEAVAADPGFQHRLARLGDDFVPMLQKELAHSLDAGDVRMNYVMARDNLRVVVPAISLVENIGFDNTGTHCPTTQRFSVDLGRAADHPRIPDGLTDNEVIIELLRRFRSESQRTQPWQDHEILDIIAGITGNRTVPASSRPVRPAQPATGPTGELGEHIIFLLGLPRSGTTLLQRLLNEHPAIHTTAEPWLLLPLCQLLKDSGQTAPYDAALARQGIQEFLLELPGGEATFVGALRNSVSNLYDKCRQLASARYFLDKTPRYHYIIPELIRLFPRAKFVFLFRNPLAVLASVAESWFGGRVADALADDSHGRDLIAGPGNLADGLSLLSGQACIVQYESLVANAEKELTRICRYLDIQFEPAMLKYDPGQRFKGRFGDSIGIPKHDHATTESVNKWQQILLRPENVAQARTYLARLPEGIVRNLGYDPVRLAEEFGASLLASVKAGQCPSELLDQSQRLCLADGACTEAEDALARADYVAAAEGLQESLNYLPSHARALNDMGAILWAIDDRRGAIARFRQAISAAPDDPTAVINCVDALTASGREGDARQICFAYLERHPDDSEIGLRYLTLGDNESGAPGSSAVAEVKADDFGGFNYSKQSHFAALGLPAEHADADIEDCDLKVFQDMLMYRFILDNFTPGARLLEIGGGDSRIIRWLKDRYEFWNLDRLEGEGNGLTSLADTQGFRLVRDYIGSFSTELPAQYFDGVFSLSTLEHVPESEECYRDILADIDRVLKPGGLSAHAFDIVMQPKGYWTNAFLPHILDNVALLHEAAPFWKIRLDPDTWTMSRSAYERLWQPVTRKAWADFGRPLSYNICWRKPVVTSQAEETEGRGSANPDPLPSPPNASGEVTPANAERSTSNAAAATDAFCILPWLHLQFNPEGSVKLCCMAGDSLRDARHAVLTPYGHSLDEIWNSTALRQVRKSMMQGERLACCALCYQREEQLGQSYRLLSNRRWAEALGATIEQLRERINSAGVEKGLELAFLQLNLGNLCNLKCRICNSSHSSQIEKDPVHSRWSPRNPSNVAGLRLATDDDSYRFGIDDLPEVHFEGFHAEERHEGIACRWTNGDGRITIPVAFPARPHRVVLKLLAYRPITSHGPGPIPLQVSINEREVFVGNVTRGVTTLELATPSGCKGSPLVIGLSSPTYQRDGRTSGIGVIQFEVRTEAAAAARRMHAIPLATRLGAGIEWNESEPFVFGELLADTHSLREVYFTGGEPFINRQVNKILATLIERGDNERVVLQFNSNFTSIDASLLETLRRFPTVNIAVSVDATGSDFEYLRYPAKWDRVAANIRKLRRLKHVRMTFVPIISAYNVMGIVGLCRYSDEIGADLALMDLGGNPSIDLGVLPPTARAAASRRLRRYAAADCRPANRQTVLRIADRLDNESFDSSQLPAFIEFTNDLDAGRHFDFRVQHAELCALMAEDGYRWTAARRFA